MVLLVHDTTTYSSTVIGECNEAGEFNPSRKETYWGRRKLARDP